MKKTLGVLVIVVIVLVFFVLRSDQDTLSPWELANRIQALPEPPLGIDRGVADLPQPPTPERVRLGRWLFYDTRMSADGSTSCATCHRPESAFAHSAAVAAGSQSTKGARQAPSLVNQTWTLYPYFLWDGGADSLETAILGSVSSPGRTGAPHGEMTLSLPPTSGYDSYFAEAFESEGMTSEHAARAIADYVRTRMSGDSRWDRWRNGDESAVSEEVKKGSALFFDQAGCSQCHVGQNLTDGTFHNLGIGWDSATQQFADNGRFLVSGNERDRGAFKTPTLRDVARHPPYMHDGSIPTLRAVIEHYNKGANDAPYLSARVFRLNLTDEEISALVALLEALNGEGFMDTPPAAFPP